MLATWSKIGASAASYTASVMCTEHAVFGMLICALAELQLQAILIKSALTYVYLCLLVEHVQASKSNTLS